VPYNAIVLPVMIASPGDVHEYRGIARDVIHEWNYIHSLESSVALMPVGWETHSSPELGSTAQELINDRVLEDCDLLIGIFWTRLGTPTGRAESGTVEEIQRHVGAGKPAMVYFSTAPASLETVDANQYAALKRFRFWCESQGLTETFSNPLDFQGKFRRHLQISLQKNKYLKNLIGKLSATDGSEPLSDIEPEATPIDALSELETSLSQEAKVLLLEAAKDNSATILNIATLSGRLIQTNGKVFNEPSDHRSSARWEHAVNQLQILGLVFARGNKNEIFQISSLGYELVDRYLNNLGKA
jgi:hypothetical protein